LKNLVGSAQFSAAKVITVRFRRSARPTLHSARRAHLRARARARACARVAAHDRRSAHAPFPPSHLGPFSSCFLFLSSQALELIESYDATKHSVGGLKGFNRCWGALLAPPSGPPPISPQSAAAGDGSRSEVDEQRGEAAAAGSFGLDARDDGDGDDGDDNGAREVGEELDSFVAPEDEAASEMHAEPEPEPEPTVDALCVQLGSIELGTEADVCHFARAVVDRFAERSAEQRLGAFVREVQMQLDARRADQERPRRQIVPHRRLSITTLAALPGVRAAAARAATPADVHASEVAALTALLAAARAELAEAKAGLARAEERRRESERKRALAEVTDGGNAPR
jgi:hypothetical protein